MYRKTRRAWRGGYRGGKIVHAFLGRLLPAERRDLRTTPPSAFLTRSSRSFPHRAAIRGSRFISAARFHLSCVSRRYAANGVRLPKGVAFGRAEKIFHKFCFKLMKQNFVTFRKTPLSALWAAQSEFSSPRHISGHAIIKMSRLHLSCGQLPAVASLLRNDRREKRRWFRMTDGRALVRDSKSGASLTKDDGREERARFAFYPVTLSGAASEKREPRSRTGLLRSPPSVISTEQREWRNLARKRTCYKFFCRVRKGRPFKTRSLD